MGEERIFLSELVALFLYFATPVYFVASILQTVILARSGKITDRRQYPLTIIGSLVLAFPLTLFLWWLLGRMPPSVFEWLGRLLPASWWGSVIVLPAIVASVLAFWGVGWVTLRQASRRR